MRQILILLIFSLGVVSAVETCKFTEFLYVPGSSTYQYWVESQDDEYNGKFCFDVRADHDAFVMLASEPISDTTKGRNVEFNLNCCSGSQFKIRSHGDDVVTSDPIFHLYKLYNDGFFNYCVTWEFGEYSLYIGQELLVQFKLKDDLFPIKVIGMNKWYKEAAVFRFDRKCSV